MPEDVQDTNQGDTQDTSAPPVPSVSDASSDEASPQSGTDVGSLVKQVASMSAEIKTMRDEMPKEVDRRFKQTTDPRFADVRKVATYLEAAGNDVDKAAKSMLLDQMIEQYEQPQSTSGAAGTAPAEDIEAETTKLLDSLKTELGVEFSREELETMSKSKAFTSNAEWYGELSTQAVKKAKSGNVTPAAVVGSSGVAKSSSGDVEETATELDELLSSSGVTKPETQKRIAELTARLEELEPTQQTGAFGV